MKLDTRNEDLISFTSIGVPVVRIYSCGQIPADATKADLEAIRKGRNRGGWFCLFGSHEYPCCCGNIEELFTALEEAAAGNKAQLAAMNFRFFAPRTSEVFGWRISPFPSAAGTELRDMIAERMKAATLPLGVAHPIGGGAPQIFEIPRLPAIGTDLAEVASASCRRTIILPRFTQITY